MWGRDPPQGYSWTSIALHWLTAVGIVVLLFAGLSISGEAAEGAIRLHISVATTLYLVFWLRIVWRLVCGHPAPAEPGHPLTHAVGVAVHFALLAGLVVMLVTGPLAAGAGDVPLSVFGVFDVPPLVGQNPAAFVVLRRIHGVTAGVISGLVTVHVLGVLKHMIFDRDGVFDRIMIAARPTRADEASAESEAS